MNVIYMACNVDTRRPMVPHDREFFYNKEDAQRCADFYDVENERLRNEPPDLFDVFGINWTMEGCVYPIPVIGNGDPNDEAYFINNNRSGEYPLEYSRIVFDDAWEGKVPQWEFFRELEGDATSRLTMRVFIHDSFDMDKETGSNGATENPPSPTPHLLGSRQGGGEIA